MYNGKSIYLFIYWHQISQLSAVSEEVTANAQQASELSDENVAQLKEAVEKIISIKDAIMELEKYQND